MSSRPRTLLGVLRILLLKIVSALAVGTVLLLIPIPPTEPVLSGRTAVVSFLIVVYIGKTIYDTLFFDRYLP